MIAIKENPVDKVKRYVVKFDNRERKDLELTESQLAHNEKPNVVLPLKYRVAAKSNGTFRLGTVGELARHLNQYRYLIFFDCHEEAAYVSLKNVYPAVSNEIPVHLFSKQYSDFLNIYFAKYPERIVFKCSVGTKAVFMHDDIWISGHVVGIDCNMLKLKSDAGSFHWVYRGSYRLVSVLLELKKLIASMNGAKANRPVRSTNALSALPSTSSDNTVVKYTSVASETDVTESGTNETKPIETDVKPSVMKRQTARKRTGPCPPITPFSSRVSDGPSTSKSSHSSRDNVVYAGSAKMTINFMSKLLVLVKPKRFIQHDCGSECVELEDLNQLKNKNPFALPIIFGKSCGYKSQSLNL